MPGQTQRLDLPVDWAKLINYKPHEVQREAHNSRAWLRLITGGNRSGKTTAGAVDTILFLLGVHPIRSESRKPPVKFRVIGTDVKAIKRYIMPKILEYLPASEISKLPSTIDNVLFLKNGSSCEFLTNEMSVLAHGGQDLDGLWPDEEPDKKIFDANMMRLVDRDGYVIMTMTPEVDETRSGISWTYEELYEKAALHVFIDEKGNLIKQSNGVSGAHLDIEGLEDKELTIECFEASTLNNPYLARRVLNSLIKRFSGRERESRIFGKYVQVQARIYWAYTDSLWPMGNLIEPISRWKAGDPYDGANKDASGHHRYWDYGWQLIEVIDPHRVKPWGLLHIMRSPGSELYCVKERLDPQDDKRTIEEYVDIIKEMRQGREPDIVLIDPSSKAFDPASGSSLFDELNKRGIFCQEADRDEKQWGWSNVNSMLNFEKSGKDRPFLYVCEDLMTLRYQIKHLTTMSWKGRAAIEEKGIIREKQRERDNDLTDCMKYGCNYFPRQIEPVDVVPGWAQKEEEKENYVINF